MNTEKARELFSDYYEGTLDTGLRQALEQQLAGESHLREEYASFKMTMDSLNTAGKATIAAPSDLHQRILARIEGSIVEEKKRTAASWTVWVRGTAIAGLAVAAGFFAFMAIRSKGGTVKTASIGTGPSIESPQRQVETAVPKYSATPNGVAMTITPSEDRPLTVENEAGDAVLKSIELSKGVLFQLPLNNQQADPVIVQIKLGGEGSSLQLLAIPGKEKATVSSGTASMSEFAKAVAGFYQAPVLLDLRSPHEQIGWKFMAGDAFDAILQAVDGQKFVVERGEGGVLRISDK